MKLSRSFVCLLILAVSVIACGGKSAAPRATSVPQGSPTAAFAAPTTSNDTPPPKACALLTTADVEKITGYGGGLADSQDMGGGESACTIITGQGKFKVQLTAGKGQFPVLPTEKTIELEGGAKAIVKHSGVSDQGWTSVAHIADYTVVLLLGGTATTLDVDKKIADVTKADGSTITYAQAYEALARAIAHNAASGAQAPSDVSDVNAKDDPCALLTLEDVKQAMTEFTITDPESSPSAYGGNKCLFRATSESLKATAIVSVVYFTQAQFEQNNASGVGKKIELAGATAFDYGSWMLLHKGKRYARFSIDVIGADPTAAEQMSAGMKKWMPQLAEKIAGRM